MAHDWSKSIERTTESGVSFTVNCPRSETVCLWQWELKFTTAENTAVWDSHTTSCSFSGPSNPPTCPPGMKFNQVGTERCEAWGQQKFSVPMALDATAPLDGQSVSLSIFIPVGMGIILMVACYRCRLRAAQSATGSQLLDVVE